MTEFIRITDLERIPQYLFEQVKGRSWTVERFYKLSPSFLSGESHRFWAVENNGEVVGVLWAVIDILSEKLNVIVYSVNKDYQDSLGVALKFLRKTATELKLKQKINWITAEPEKIKEIGGQIPGTIMLEV